MKLPGLEFDINSVSGMFLIKHYDLLDAEQKMALTRRLYEVIGVTLHLYNQCLWCIAGDYEDVVHQLLSKRPVFVKLVYKPGLKNMQLLKVKKYCWFVGTDISKNKLDHAVMQDKQLLFHRQTANSDDSIKEFILSLKSLPGFSISKCIFCIENTGVYANHWVEGLRRFKAHIVREQASVIMKSQEPIRGKSDKLDAIRIAEYAYLHCDRLRLLSIRRPVVEQLQLLNALRLRLTTICTSIKTPLEEDAAFKVAKLSALARRHCEQSLAAISTDVASLNRAIQDLIRSDAELNHLYTIILSVPFLGPVTAVNILIATNEFKDINDPKKFACYAGIAPFPVESGTIQRKRKVSQLANRKMKWLLHLCAIQAMRYCPELKVFYLRKTKEEGKAKMAVINAIRYKLILRVFACVNQNRLFQQNYVNPRCVTAGASAG